MNIYIEPFNKELYFINTLKSRRGIILPQSTGRGVKCFLIKLVVLEKCLKLGSAKESENFIEKQSVERFNALAMLALEKNHVRDSIDLNKI